MALKRKILYIAPGLDVKGGITTVLIGYLKSNLSKSFELQFIVSHKDGPKIFKFFVALNGLLFAIIKLTFFRPDIVHIHCGDLPSPLRKYIFFCLAKLFNSKVILHLHGGSFINQYYKLTSAWRQRLCRFFENVDRLVCLCESCERNIKIISPKSKTIIVHNSVPIPNYITDLHQTSPSFTLAFLGHIVQRKGLFDLMEVLAELRDKGEKIDLNVGGIGDLPFFFETIKKLHIEKQVRYLGWVDQEEKKHLLQHVDVFVLPSYAEGMPMALIEAMSYGLPVIASRVGGIPELVHHEHSGLLIEPGDKQTLARQICRLLSDPELRQTLGENARQRIAERYDFNNMVSQIENLYRSLLMNPNDTQPNK